MKNIFQTKVYYSDTDAYSVVWHGAYLKWMEKGRVDFCEDMGYDLVQLKEKEIVLPVASIDIKYKASAKLNDCILVETEVEKFSPLYIIFKQIIKNNNKIFVEAHVKVVAINNEGKLYRKMPNFLYKSFEENVKCD